MLNHIVSFEYICEFLVVIKLSRQLMKLQLIHSDLSERYDNDKYQGFFDENMSIFGHKWRDVTNRDKVMKDGHPRKERKIKTRNESWKVDQRSKPRVSMVSFWP